MAFPKFHGINLAANGFIENLRVERLAADPSPVSAGRVWYNTTEKALKYSSLDDTGAVVVQAFGNVTYIDSQVSSEAQARSDADDALDARLTTVETDYAQTSYVDQKIASLGNAFEYVGTIDGGVDAASALDLSTLSQTAAGDYYKVTTAGYFKATSGDTAFYLNANDGVLFNSAGGVDTVDNTNAQVQGTTDFVTVTGSADTGFTVDVAQAFKDRVSTLETEAGDLTTLTTDAKGDLVSALNEVDANADAVQGELDTTQTGAGLGTDGTYAANAGANYIASATSLKDADDKLDAALKSEANRAKAAEGDLSTLSTTAKASLVAAINEVDAAAGEGAAQLKTDINNQRATFQSGAAALNHSVAHGLNSAFVSVQVWVEGSDGIYRNDIVAVEETDNNTVSISLTEAANVKVAVQSLTDLA